MEPVDLAVTDLYPSVDDPALNSMNFLKEVARHYPDAVSLAAGLDRLAALITDELAAVGAPA